jgi:ATP-dependent Clp protease ATP-binding subunit ClpA
MVSVFANFSGTAQRAIESAPEFAKATGSTLVTTDHIAIALMTDTTSHFRAVLRSFGLEPAAVVERVRELQRLPIEREVEAT